MSLTRPASGQPRAASASIGPLGVVQHLRPGRVGQPGGERRVVLGVELGRRRRTPRRRLAVGEGDAVDRRRCREPQRAADVHADALVAACSASQSATSPAPSTRPASSKPASSIASSSGPSVSSSRSRSHPELEPVEEGVHGLAVPRLAGQVAGPALEVEVADQRVEPAVADHVAEVLAQRLALLAGDLVGVGDDVVEAVVLVDPLRGVALADPGHAGQVVGGLAHDAPRARGSAPAGRRTSSSTAVGRHPRQVGDAAHRVEHRRRRR